MDDKPQEPSKVASNQDFWKYLGLFAISVIALLVLLLLIVCLLVFAIFFMPLKEMTLKLPETGDEAKMRTILEHHMGQADTSYIGEIMTKLTELEGTVHKELKMKVRKLEDRLNDNDIQTTCTCNEEETTRIYHDSDNLMKLMNELEQRVDSEMKAKLADLQVHTSTEIESIEEGIMKKLAEQESSVTTDETEQKLFDFGERLDTFQALLGEKKYVSMHFILNKK